jgi:hypothetical protein
VDIGDREQILEDPLETDVFTVVRRRIQLQQCLEGTRLMSRRWGISIPSSSFPNEICFINSGMYHPRAGENRPAPAAAANFAAPE